MKVKYGSKQSVNFSRGAMAYTDDDDGMEGSHSTTFEYAGRFRSKRSLVSQGERMLALTCA